MGKMSRTKGRAAEQEVARLLRPVFPDAQRRCSGDETRDECPGRDLEEVPGWCVQVECSGKPRPLRKLAEAAHGAHGTEIPIAIVRQSSRKGSTSWAALFRFEDALHMMHVYERFRLAFPKRLEELRMELEPPEPPLVAAEGGTP